MARAALALAALLALAGCGATPAPGTPVTPAEVPEAPEAPPTTGSAPAELAPGLGTWGVTDPGRLADAHAAVLADRSFTVRGATTRRYRNGTVRLRSERVVRMGADRRRFLTVSTRQSRVEHDWRLEQYANGSHVLRRTTAGAHTRFSVLRGPDGRPRGPLSLYPENATNRGGVSRLLGLVDADVTGSRVEDGRRLYDLAVEGDGPAWLENLRMVATVDERGLVRSYVVSYTVTREGRQVRVTVEFAVTRVGSTAVPEPSWV